MKLKAKDLKIGQKVIVIEFGERFVYKLTHVQHFPPIGEKYGAAFIAVGTEEWDKGIPGIGSALDLNEQIEIEE